jgi:tetratricopeptide (TPR) repeat protein
MLRRAFFLLLLLCTTLSGASEKTWTEVRSQHFRILTNGSKSDTIRVAREFEQMRWVFATRLPYARLESGAPLTVFAVRDEATAKELDPLMWKLMGERLAGAFHHGWEKEYAVVRLDTWGGEGSKEVVYHEYTHSILRLNSHWLPLWLNEGWAEFYGFTRFESHRVYLGAPTERHHALRNKTPMPVQTLISLNSVPSDEDAFYVQSWALVHYLTYGEGMENGKKLGQFFALLQQGKPQEKAFQEVFGDFKVVDKSFDAYFQQPTYATTILKDSPQIDERSVTERPLSVAETEAELAGFHLLIHDRDGARTLLEDALKSDPKLGLAHENMGFLNFSYGKDADALNEFSQACALDNKLYLSVFAKTMMSPLPTSNSVDDMNAFGAILGKVLQINPQFAPAYVQLARLAVREGDLQSASLVSRKAEELEPSLAGYHLLSGQILLRMGKGTDAAESAKFVADRWVGPDRNEAVELWNRVPASDRSGDPLFKVAPKDTEAAEGLVKTIACAEKGQEFRMIVDQGVRSLTFYHKGGGIPVGFSDMIWYGGDHFNMCHHIEGLRAIVYYHKPSDTTYAGDIVELEIRDDLPEPTKQP